MWFQLNHLSASELEPGMLLHLLAKIKKNMGVDQRMGHGTLPLALFM